MGDRPKLIVVLTTALVLGALTIRHAAGLNGPWYWKWPWVRLDGSRLFPAMFLAAVPFALAQWKRGDDGRRDAFAVTLLMLSTLGLQLAVAGLHRRTFDLGSVADTVQDPIATSYFLDARDLALHHVSLRDWLSNHSERMPSLRLHSRFKPPGLILYHLIFISAFGSTRLAALTAGLTLALLACTSVAATYFLILALCADRDAAFHGASFLSLCPSLVLFLPQFDQCYPTVACALVGIWAAALARNRDSYALALGLILTGATFMSQMFLVLGVVLAGLGVLHVAKGGRSALVQVLRLALVAAVTLVSAYAALWIVSGYDPISTYRTALRLLAGYPIRAMRPYPIHAVFDLLDFALGSGWISFVLVICYVVDLRLVPRASRNVALLALGHIVLIAAAGIVPGETARTWTLMLPLLMIPIGLELALWSRRARLAVYGALWFVLSALAQNMQFVIASKT